MSRRSGEYEELYFTGESAEEAENFIQAVNKRAYAAGKQKDNAWIAEFAYPFFSRKALRWYEELDEATQNDWKLLKRAILAEYQGKQPAPSTVPSAAPALISSPPSLTPAAPPPSAVTLRLGYVRVDCGDPRGRGYLAEDGRHGRPATIMNDRSKACVFEADISARTLKFQRLEEYLVVGIIDKGHSFAPGTGQYGRLMSSSTGFGPSVQSRWDDIWTIKDNGILSASVRHPNQDRTQLEAVAEFRGTGFVYFTPSASVFLGSYGREVYGQVTLHFEPLS